MSNQNHKEQTWWECNKKKVLTVGVIGLVAGTSLILFKNKDVLLSLINNEKVMSIGKELADIQSTETAPEAAKIIATEPIVKHLPLNGGAPFKVMGHIRNLPNGYHPSAKKIAEAEKMGYVLGQNQTVVSTHFKNVA